MPKLTEAEILTQKRIDLMMAKIERAYTFAIAREKNRYIRKAADNFTIFQQLLNRDYDVHRKNMLAISERYNKKAIKIFVKDFNNTIKPQVKSLEIKQDEEELFLQSLFDWWLVNQTASKAIQTATTTREDIQKAINEAYVSDETNPDIPKRILKTRGLSIWRADTIARTETHNAAIYASKESAKKLQTESETELLKVWVPAEDERTRSGHRSMVDHPAIAIDELFHVDGEQLDRPGDPSGSARNVINCRCVLSYRVAE